MSIEAKPEDRDANHTAPDAPFQLEDQAALLCHNCAQLDFGKIRQQKVQGGWNGDHVMDLGDRTSLLASTCPLCQLFGATVEEYPGLHLRAYRSPLGAPGETRYNVLGVSSKNIFDTMLSLYGNGHLAIESSQNDTRLSSTKLVNPGAFNLDIARQCWEYCSSNHVATCGKTNACHSYPFKVIDCFSRIIIDAPKHCKYAALSYVWGNVSSAMHTESSKSQEDNLSLLNLPKTIEDSISVTMSMSLRYLWVDRYCINQFDHRARELQIKQMDAIYSLAELTIVAAAGHDPHHGLPGVDGTWRNPQQSIRLGEYCIRQTLPAARASLSNSTWSKRAWTYQEIILSRRRLIFTCDQVFYECQEMLCSESLNIPLDTAVLIYPDKYANWARNLVNGPQRITAGLKNGILGVWACIREYSHRKLSFQEDTLNAMRGILEAARKGPRPVYHLSGLPVLERGSNMDTTQQFLMNLAWEPMDISERVTILPSWSWAGWYTGSVFEPRPFLYNTSPTLENVTDSTEAASYSQSLDNEECKSVVWIENQGSLIEYPSDETSAVELLTSLNDIRFIHITTWVIPCRVVVDEDEFFPSRYYATLMFEKHEITEQLVPLSRNMAASDLERFRQEHGSLLGMVLPNVHHKNYMFVLLVGEMGGHYERLGSIFISDGVDKNDVKSAWKDLVSGPKRTIRLG